VCICSIKQPKTSPVPAILPDNGTRPSAPRFAASRRVAQTAKTQIENTRSLPQTVIDTMSAKASDVHGKSLDASSANETAPDALAFVPKGTSLTEGEVRDSEEVSDDAPPPAPLVDPAKLQFLQTLQRAKEGDKKAFEEIYQLYHRRIYNAVYGMLSDPDDAQDVTQDVFMRLHDALPTLRADEAFLLICIVSHLTFVVIVRAAKSVFAFRAWTRRAPITKAKSSRWIFPDPGKLPEETLSNDELQSRVRQAVQTLSDDHKAVIVMHHFQAWK
jgi:RNA polymerase sigma-70 factor (ECF subfamily)